MLFSLILFLCVILLSNSTFYAHYCDYFFLVIFLIYLENFMDFSSYLESIPSSLLSFKEFLLLNVTKSAMLDFFNLFVSI